jgi:hypothetical protein
MSVVDPQSAPPVAAQRTQRSGRLRRPSGEVPSLPPGTGWQRSVVSLAAVLVLGVTTSILLRAGIGERSGAELLRTIVDGAPPWLTSLSEDVDVLGGVVAVGLLRLSTVIVLLTYKRWRHLVAFLVALVLTDWAVVRVLGVERTPPEALAPMTDRATFWFPSRPVASLAVTLVGMAIVLLPSGRSRRLGLATTVSLSLAYAVARTILGADYVLDAAYAVLLAVALPTALFIAFVPDDVFPVRYSRSGPSAHLDLGADRRGRIVEAMAEQLGVEVTEVEAFGLAGSGGSSPLRMRVEGSDDHLFAKIYSTNHLRSDRWYRFGRTLLYGQLEDEVPFGSVRRLVEYEDYALRLLDDVGIRVARTHGVVELIPNREYMVVTEFFESATTLDEAEVDDTVIDEGLELVRTMWDRGLAHRDIKPANLLVRHGHLQLVDVSALEVRPSRWRQLVDLANMMLVLALQSDPERVLRRATRLFDEDDIGEAFAADIGLAVPTQLQARLKADPRRIRDRFEELVPARDPIAIQRWSLRRSALLIGTVLGVLVLVAMFVDALMAGLR